MAEILLFGATGYTGRLTARALGRRGADFAVAGRDPAKVREIADETGASDPRVATINDVDGLVDALRDVQVLVTCVGPFVHLGETAVEAALRAGVNYIDSTGEAAFIQRLIEKYDRPARSAGIALAPALAFDDAPADLAASLATDGLGPSDLVITYAVPTQGSAGTIRTLLDIATTKGAWLEDGKTRWVKLGEERRWAPMPPPLGPRPSVSLPFAEGHLAPLHLELRSLKTFGTVGSLQRLALPVMVPALKTLRAVPGSRWALERLLPSGKGPSERARARGRFTILAEARAATRWRNVVLQGADVYGLSAELLAAGALKMTDPGYSVTGVVAPVQAVGVDILEKELNNNGVAIRTLEDG